MESQGERNSLALFSESRGRENAKLEVPKKAGSKKGVWGKSKAQSGKTPWTRPPVGRRPWAC